MLRGSTVGYILATAWLLVCVCNRLSTAQICHLMHKNMFSYVSLSFSDKNWLRRKEVERVNFKLLGVLRNFLTPVYLDKH